MIQKIKQTCQKIADKCSAEYVCDLVSGECHPVKIPGISHLHSYCHNNLAWYRFWHHHPYRRHVHFGIFFIFLFSFLILSFIYFKTVSAAPNFIIVNIKNSKNENVQAKITILDKNDRIIAEGESNNGLTFKGSKKIADKIEIDFNNGPVTSLELDDIILSEDNINIPLDEIAPVGFWNKMFALGDIQGLTFSKGRFKKIAEGKDLFKCANWDFANQKCLGRWVKKADLVPGQEYTVEFTPGDPGYAESSRKVNALNKNKELFDYKETEVSGGVTLAPDLSGSFSLPVAEITVNQIDSTSQNNDLIIDQVNVATDNIAKKAMLIDTTNLAAAETKITDKAENNVLLNCLNYDETNGCLKWKKEKNITPAENYDLTISSPGQSVFGQSRDGLLVLDKNFEVLPPALQTIEPEKIAVQFADMNPYKITTYLDTENTALTNEIVVDGVNQAAETPQGKNMSFDLGSASISSADIDAQAVGYDLFRCDKFDTTTQTCQGKYKKVKDLVKGGQYTFNIVKQDGVSEFFESKKQIALLNKDDELFDYAENIVTTETGTDIEITPTTPGVIKKIKVKNHLENTPNDLKIDEEVLTPDSALQSFAVDPSGLADSADLEIEAKGNTLYKCKDWDFVAAKCLGSWEKYKDLTPGETYTLTVDQNDPGFMETNETPPSAGSDTGSSNASSGGSVSSGESVSSGSNVSSSDSGSSGGSVSSGGGNVSSSGSVSSGGGGAVILFSPPQNPPTATLPPPEETPPVSTTEETPPVTVATEETPPVKAPSPSLPKVTLSSEFKLLEKLNHGLGEGRVGEEIKALQKFLNQLGLMVAKTGPGSPGKETNYFGLKTRAAVKRFQLKYNLTRPTDPGFGYIGPKTRAKIKELLKEF